MTIEPTPGFLGGLGLALDCWLFGSLFSTLALLCTQQRWPRLCGHTSFGPNEGFGIGVGLGDDAVDGELQVDDGLESQRSPAFIGSPGWVRSSAWIWLTWGSWVEMFGSASPHKFSSLVGPLTSIRRS